MEEKKIKEQNSTEEEQKNLIKQIKITQDKIEKETRYNHILFGIFLIVSLLYIHFKMDNLGGVVKTLIDIINSLAGN